MPDCIDSSLVRHAHATRKALEQKSLTIVTAESCTAGLIAGAMSQVDGASQTLHGSFEVYTKANMAKALGLSVRYLRSRVALLAKLPNRCLRAR